MNSCEHCEGCKLISGESVSSYFLSHPVISTKCSNVHVPQRQNYEIPVLWRQCFENTLLAVLHALHTAQKNEPCTLLKLGSYLMKNYITNCGVEGYALYPQSDCSSLRLLHPTLRKRAVFTLVAHLEQDFLVISWYISDNQTTPLSPICGKPFNNDFIVFLDTIAYPLTYPLIHHSYSFHIPELCNLFEILWDCDSLFEFEIWSLRFWTKNWFQPGF